MPASSSRSSSLAQVGLHFPGWLRGTAPYGMQRMRVLGSSNPRRSAGDSNGARSKCPAVPAGGSAKRSGSSLTAFKLLPPLTFAVYSFRPISRQARSSRSSSFRSSGPDRPVFTECFLATASSTCLVTASPVSRNIERCPVLLGASRNTGTRGLEPHATQLAAPTMRTVNS